MLGRTTRAALVFVAVLAAAACSGRSGDRARGLTSPSGKYALRVPIERASGREFSAYWHPSIFDARGALLYEDTEGFPARFQVYWAWDTQDRAWLYNSDDGARWYYERDASGSWHRLLWRSGGPSPAPGLVPAGRRR